MSDDFTDRVVQVPAHVLSDLVAAVKDLRHALTDRGNFHGGETARKVAARLSAHGNGLALCWMDAWYGLNHQKIKVGDAVRYNDGSGELFPAEVVGAYELGALLLDENGVEWNPWHRVHRLDRLHSEPEFDVANFASIATWMELRSDPATWGEPTDPPLYLTPGGARTGLLRVVPSAGTD